MQIVPGEAMKTVLQYARSVNSSNLVDDETHHNLDILAAVALTSALGGLLFRVKYSGDEMSLKPLMLIWREMVLIRAKRGKWLHVAEEVADISMWAWIDEICHTCKGRKFEEIPNTPSLAAIVCPDCGGTGKRKLACDAEIRDFVLDSIQCLESMAREAGSIAHKKLR